MSAARGRAPGARALNGYTTCISLAGCILLLWSLREARTALPGLLLFVALGIVAELTTSEGIMPQIAFSLSSTVAYATAVGLGHLSAALVGAVGGLATTLIKAEADRREGRKRGASLARRAMFNVAALSLAPAAGGAVYVLLGGTVGGLLGVRDALPLVAGAACAELVNGVIVVGAVSLQTGQPAWRLWRQSVSWALPMNVLGLAVGGGGLAMGYRIAGVVGVAVFSLPLALTIYAFRLYVTQTKVQMRRCEETIAERTAELQAANRELQDEITDRQRVEMELLLKAQLLDSVTDSIFVYDLDGNLTYVNEAAYRSRGYTRSELLALRPRELTAPPYRDRHEAWVRQVLERGEITYESADLRKDGSVMPVEVHARTVVSDGQKLILSVARDVTERRRLEDQLHHAQRMETVGRLAGGIAHDFNNILTAITGYASFAHNALRPGDPARDDIAQVLQGAERAASLVRQLLAFSRRQVTAPRPTNLNQVVLNLEKMLRRVIGEDIELVTVPAPNLGTVRVDPGQIEQVLTNLAVNGRDAMAAGGQLVIETANVRLDEEYARQHVSVTPGDYVMVAVSDTGCGMSDEVKGRVFEPYFTTKAPGKGTGLGLATCYGIVKQNGGHIWFYSEVGKGTTFKVYFPRIEEAPMEVSPREREPDTERRARTVLLAEDEPAVRSFAARVLRQAGYCVLEAANGQHALELAAGRDGDMVDLLLTDLVMPQMSGVELHRRLRASYPGLKTLFMSGYTDDVASYQNLPTDGVAYLQKPFTAASLSGEVQELLSCR